MVADRLTVTPSNAEAWVAYLRKTLISLVPILLAGLLILTQDVNAGKVINGVTWVSVALAVAQAALTYLPSNAVAKLIASLVVGLAAPVAAALTNGGISLAEGLLILVQFLVWAGAAVAPNGAHPNVVLRELPGPGARVVVKDRDAGDVDVVLILIVFTFVGVLLLLFGISFS